MHREAAQLSVNIQLIHVTLFTTMIFMINKSHFIN